MMSSILNSLQATGYSFEVIAIDPLLSDTATFCEHYGFALENAANTLFCTTKNKPPVYFACVLLATTKLDANRSLKTLLSSKVSFATVEQMQSLTEMEIGAVTPFGLDSAFPVYVDAKVMQREAIFLGAGKRDEKIKISPQALLKLPQTQVVPGLAIPKV